MPDTPEPNRWSFDWWCEAPGVNRWLRSMRCFDTWQAADFAATGWLMDCQHNLTPTRVRVVDLKRRPPAKEEQP